MGYHRAGFVVTGVDLYPQPNYPFAFHQADALEYVKEHGHEFDVIHASPPCQAYSTITRPEARVRHIRLIEPTRLALAATGSPYVIENVAGARAQLIDPMMLCGSSFDLAVRRHRFFESNVTLGSLPCRHVNGAPPIGVYGGHPDTKHYLRPGLGTSRGRRATSNEQASAALGGVSWMNWHEMTESIPPAYTEHIGKQLLAHIVTVSA